MVRMCAQCGAEAKSQCAQCQKVWYCSPACQRLHWRAGHRGQCGAVIRSGEAPKRSPQQQQQAPATASGATTTGQARNTSSSPASRSPVSTAKAVADALSADSSPLPEFKYIFASNDDEGHKVGMSVVSGDTVTPTECLFDRKQAMQLLEFNPEKLAHRTKSGGRRPQHDTFDELIPVGLTNFGNSCFLNSVIQCLRGTRALRTFLKFNRDHEDEVVTAPGKPDAVAKCPRLRRGDVCARCLISTQFRRMDAAALSGLNSVGPRDLFRMLPAMGDFVQYHQADSHEYATAILTLLGNCLTEDAMRARHGYKDPAAPFCPPRIEATSLLNQLFGGVIQSRIKCTTCGFSSTTFDFFMEMMLELPSSESIEQALEQFTSVEKVEGWKCSRCAEARVGSKQLTVMRPPRLLIATLKRFDFVHGGMKVNKRVVFREELHLSHVLSKSSPFANTGAHYQLYAVIVHFGKSSFAGHYVAFVRGDEGQWVLCDDDKVVEVSTSTVLKQNGYMFFYKRDDTHAESIRRTLTASDELEDGLRADAASHTGPDVAVVDAAPANSVISSSDTRQPPAYWMYHVDQEEVDEQNTQLPAGAIGVGRFGLRVKLPRFAQTAGHSWIDVKVTPSGLISVFQSNAYSEDTPYPYSPLSVRLPFALHVPSVRAQYFAEERELLISVSVVAGQTSEETAEEAFEWVRVEDCSAMLDMVCQMMGFVEEHEVEGGSTLPQPVLPKSEHVPVVQQRLDTDEASYEHMWEDIMSTHKRGVRLLASEGRTSNTQTKQSVAKTVPKVGRNDACPCGSGRKYKACHGK